MPKQSCAWIMAKQSQADTGNTPDIACNLGITIWHTGAVCDVLRLVNLPGAE